MISPPFWTAAVKSFDEYLGFLDFFGGELDRRHQLEAALVPTDHEPFRLPGYCAVCAAQTNFIVDLQFAHILNDGTFYPNWRERLVCETCNLNNRMRAALHLLARNLGAYPTDKIYITEQVTPLFSAVSRRYNFVIGSEFLTDSTLPGNYNAAGIRFEDLTKLTFRSNEFNYILSFDVLEHVPQYKKALSEISRCLAPGGKLLLSVPMDLGLESTVTRAHVDASGEIIHLKPPEYHGDPLNKAGVLAYYNFGWSLIDDLRNEEFQNARVEIYWSQYYGYLGEIQFIIYAEKSI